MSNLQILHYTKLIVLVLSMPTYLIQEKYPKTIFHLQCFRRHTNKFQERCRLYPKLTLVHNIQCNEELLKWLRDTEL